MSSPFSYVAIVASLSIFSYPLKPKLKATDDVRVTSSQLTRTPIRLGWKKKKKQFTSMESGIMSPNRRNEME